MLAQMTALILMWLSSFASSKLRAFLSLGLLLILVTWQREIITTQEVIILSYDKGFPEQNNLFEFQTHMCRNHYFLCGGQLFSTNRMRRIMPTASAFGTMPVPGGSNQDCQWPICMVSPAGECETATCKQVWVRRQWRSTASDFGCPGPLHTGKWRAGPLAGSHRWKALVSLWCMEELAFALVSFRDLILNSKTNTNARDFLLKKKQKLGSLTLPRQYF